MASIKRTISKKVNGNGKAEIYLRLAAGKRGVQLRFKSGVFIAPTQLKPNGEFIFPRSDKKAEYELRALEKKLKRMEEFLIDLATTTPADLLTKEYLSEMLEKYRHPEKAATPKTQSGKTPSEDMGEAFALYLSKKKFGTSRIQEYRGLLGSLTRFSLYCKQTRQRRRITPNGMTAEDLEAFAEFLRNEEEVYYKYPRIYEVSPCNTRKGHKSGIPAPRSHNTMVKIFGCLSAFFRWSSGEGITQNNPFAKFEGIGTEMYGDPVPLTKEERDYLADYDLTDRPALAVQRDIFIFQCFIGCRVSDLSRLTTEHVKNGVVEYIPYKTRNKKKKVCHVPLHSRALAILERYADPTRTTLLPCISDQKYNKAIAEICEKAGLNRLVTVPNKHSGEEEQVPLFTVVRSHTARRTFVDLLTAAGVPQYIICEMTGHAPGSKAISRYRNIDGRVTVNAIAQL